MPDAIRKDLLVEIGCEELPPKALDALRQALFDGVVSALENDNFHFDTEGSRAYSTPRRLALLLKDVPAQQPDQEQERRGPALSAAFDADGAPTKAAAGFARSVGREVSDLETRETEKGAWLYARLHVPGKPLGALLYRALEQAIRQLPVPRPMRWAGNDFSFVRPVHWLVVLHGDAVVDGELLGQPAGNATRGHRIHAPGPHEIPTASDYLGILEGAFVLGDHEKRIERIRQMLLAEEANTHIDAGLLREVNNLVEWPVVVSCAFEEDFLNVPHPALIASMQDHQRFFPVLDAAGAGNITNRFLAVSNVDSTDPSAVRHGYERVIRPRLADARFFLEQDLKRPLPDFVEALDTVVYQRKIGTIGDKRKRIEYLSEKIAELLFFDPEHAMRAAHLSKCDLMTQMVGEFPELQGVMGNFYAASCGEHEAVALAIEEHYAPRFAGDAIPASRAGQVVSIADRIDTLVGVFAAGLRPTGNKDPFALRRAALGLVRILLEARLELSLNRLLALAANELAGQLTVEPDLLLDIRDFIVQRTRNHYREQGFSAELITAVIASEWDSLPDLDARLRALSGFMGRSEAASLAAANKRIGNILRQAGGAVSEEIVSDRFVSAEERRLFADLLESSEHVRPLLEKGDYVAVLERLAGLRGVVDDFFDSVMVMDEDPALRANRLALLSRLKSLFDRVADLSVLG